MATISQRRRAGQLWDSEALTIMIHIHQSQYQNFKAYYQQHVQVYLQAEFPHLIRDGRFVPRMGFRLQVHLVVNECRELFLPHAH